MERIIASGRVALAAASLFGVWMDPTEPARYESEVYALHVIFLTYSLGLATFVALRPVGDRLPIASHITDITFVSVLQYLTLGPSSPFFLYFIFSLFCAAMRWGWQGTLATAGVTLMTYVVMGIWMSRTLGPTEFEFNRFAIRAVYLIVSAGLLVYLGRHEARLRNHIERLARWPAPAGADIEHVVAQLLEHAVSIVGAGRVVAIWDAGEEPDVRVATWPGGDRHISTHPPGALNPAVGPELVQATFLCAGPVHAGSVPLVDNGDGRLVPTAGRIHPEALAFVEGTGLASAPFRTERVSGRLFFTDLGPPAAELVPLTEVVAREVGASLDQLYATEHMKELAASEERILVARDLHDGVLQSLTGVRLEIRAVAAALDATPNLRDRLFAIERALSIEQRELRFFIGGLGRHRAAETDDGTLAQRLTAMRERIALEWKMRSRSGSPRAPRRCRSRSSGRCP
jgi:signal transduction histidine kinase